MQDNIRSIRFSAETETQIEAIQAAYPDPLGEPLSAPDAIRLAIRNEASRCRESKQRRKRRETQAV